MSQLPSCAVPKLRESRFLASLTSVVINTQPWPMSAESSDVSVVLFAPSPSFVFLRLKRDFPPNLPPRAFSSGIKIAPPSCAYSVVLRCAPLPRGRDFHPSVVRDVCQFRSGPSQKAKEKEGVPAQPESCTFLHSAKNYTSYPNPLAFKCLWK